MREKPFLPAFLSAFLIVFLGLQFLQGDSFIVTNILSGLGAGFLATLFLMLFSSRKRVIVRFELVEEQHRKHPDGEIKLPEKATACSTGYDFYAPERYRLKPKEKHMFWTDVKVRLRLDEKLEIIPRSSTGGNKSIMLANTVGWIDPDYYGNEDNDGNIGIWVYNYGDDFVTIEKNERFAQGSIVKVVLDVAKKNGKERAGGFGSTGQ